MILAIVNEWVVDQIVSLPDGTDITSWIQDCQIAIDITNMNPQPQIGWTFNGGFLVTNIASGPMSVKITKLAFRERFTMSELIAILQASETDYVLQVLEQNQMMATYVDLARTDTQAGVEYLVTKGLLTQPRAVAILTTPPTLTELYTG